MDLSEISNHKGGSPMSMESNQPNLRLHVMLLEMPNKQSLAKYGQIDQGDQINEPVDYILRNGELPNNQDCRAQMIHRCKKLILSTSQWTSNGILMYNEENRLVKSAIFQNAWNNQIIILRNRINMTNKDVPVVEVPNDIPAKVSESNIDPDEPMKLVDENKTVSRVELEHLDSEKARPVLGDTPLNVTDKTYHFSASYCHGLPNFESDIPDSQVPSLDTASSSQSSSSRNDIMAEVIFLKDSKRINYSSEALLSNHTQKFKACAEITVLTPNKVRRKVFRDAMSMIWDSIHDLVLFWKSVALRASTIIKITFPDAAWLPGVTVDINSDDDLLKARQTIWNGFWIFIAKQPETLVSTFNINATPESPQVSVALSKRQRNSIPNDAISIHQKDGLSPCSSDAYDVAFRNYMAKIGSQRSYDSSIPCEGSPSIGQVPMSPKSLPLLKRPAKRPRLTEQQPTTTQTELSNTTSDPILAKQQMPQRQIHQIHQQEQGPHPILSLAESHILGSAYHPQSQRFIQAQPLQPNSIHTQPRTSLPLIETAAFHHEPNNSLASYAYQASPRTNHSPRSQTLSAMSPAPTAYHEIMPSQCIPRMPTPTHTSSYQYPPYTHASAPMSPPETMARSQYLPLAAHNPPPMPIPRLNHHTPTFNDSALPQSPPITPYSHRFPTYPSSNPTLTPAPTIQFRIQLQPNGPFSPPYPKSILGTPGKLATTTSQFFTSFTANTSPIPGGNPDSLTF
ncbi:hypothetical protein BOTNAR_0373g00050 [Botryotinia narcissicola]|uniref:Uncharacterized protein n=1 Tax=Botryotinia narcissicola TaxID=278944 RepID=A0A4Z1I206_9HELO|nr:hypothetical protein BOTNAR_0373g00050 [Botryotinia narcissicola]